MIVDLPETSTSAVNAKLVQLRAQSGAMALTRVLTLIVVTDAAWEEQAIATANAASRQHPCRVIVVTPESRRGKARLDAQIRLGGDAGASEVVVLRLRGPLADEGRSVITPLLLADSPIVAWWPRRGPVDPAGDPIGAMARRRVTDSSRMTGAPRAVLTALGEHYTDGDTDLAWSRITLWRGLLATALDQPPYESVQSAVVTAAPDSPSGDLLAGWLAHRLRCPVSHVRSPHRTGIISVRLERKSGAIDLVRPEDGNVATLIMPGQPERTISLAHRSDAECLADELHRLDPDEVYEDALRRGLPDVTQRRMSAAVATRRGEVPDVAEAERTAKRLMERAREQARSAMVSTRDPDSGHDDTDAVRTAARERLAAKQES